MASQLDRWLATLSRGTIAILAIGGGMAFIILADPPRTVCDTQLDFFKEQQRGFLFSDPKIEDPKTKPLFFQMMAFCENGNGPGSCYELFGKLRIMLRDLSSIPDECAAKAGRVDEINLALWASAKFMIEKAAWGKKPPESYQERFGWLDTADVALFCSLKREILRAYGTGQWEVYQEQLFQGLLPGARDLPRKETWQRSLLPEDCRSQNQIKPQ